MLPHHNQPTKEQHTLHDMLPHQNQPTMEQHTLHDMLPHHNQPMMEQHTNEGTTYISRHYTVHVKY
jgi:hypothetical protein